MDRDILLACRDASLGYEHRALLEHLTFTVRAGDYLCVVGENGSGKSTLMKSLLGLLPPLVGTIDCPAQRAGAIGYLPQQTSAQRDFPATVSEVVLSGFANKRGLHFFYSAAEKSAALMNMGKLGVLELQNRCYRELSGGQQQRVLLARALCAADRLLILDEPVTGLDPAATQDLYKTLRYLNEKRRWRSSWSRPICEARCARRPRFCTSGDGWFFGTVAEYLASPAGKRFGGAL